MQKADKWYGMIVPCLVIYYLFMWWKCASYNCMWAPLITALGLLFVCCISDSRVEPLYLPINNANKMNKLITHTHTHWLQIIVRQRAQNCAMRQNSELSQSPSPAVLPFRWKSKHSCQLISLNNENVTAMLPSQLYLC